jgi:hypothetical protein
LCGVHELIAWLSSENARTVNGRAFEQDIAGTAPPLERIELLEEI